MKTATIQTLIYTTRLLVYHTLKKHDNSTKTQAVICQFENENHQSQCIKIVNENDDIKISTRMRRPKA